MQEIGAVEKNRVNQKQSFNFRGIDDVYNAVQKIMAKHQVFTTVEIEPISRTEVVSKQNTKGVWVHNRYHYTFHAADSSSVITTADGEAVDYGDKASNKAASISHKYALIQTFAIPTKIDDPDATTNEISATAPDKRHVAKVNEIYAKLGAVGVSKQDLIDRLGYDIANGMPNDAMEKIYNIFNQAHRKIMPVNNMPKNMPKK